MLSSTPLSSRGPTQLLILDIHALQIRFYFGDSIIPRLQSGIPLLTRELRKLSMEGQSSGNEYNFAIAFPDDGACKRFKGMFDDSFPSPIIICNKVRENNRKIVTVKEGSQFIFNIIWALDIFSIMFVLLIKGMPKMLTLLLLMIWFKVVVH